MATQNSYIESVQDTSEFILNNSAPNTGQYYSHIYSGRDPSTGVPTMEVRLLQKKPIPIKEINNTQTLEVVKISNFNKDNKKSYDTNIITNDDATTPANSDIVFDGGGTTLAGSLILALLIGLATFVYFIIRMWQNNQVHRMVISKIESVESKDAFKDTPTTDSSLKESVNKITTPIITKEINWRDTLLSADKKLDELLTSKGLMGDSISDKLKTVHAGQFKAIDVAWEAHKGTEQLLKMHDGKVSKNSVKRILKLYKQVFAEHGLV